MVAGPWVGNNKLAKKDVISRCDQGELTGENCV